MGPILYTPPTDATGFIVGIAFISIVLSILFVALYFGPQEYKDAEAKTEVVKAKRGRKPKKA
jgi:hypothetical protein